LEDLHIEEKCMAPCNARLDLKIDRGILGSLSLFLERGDVIMNGVKTAI